MYGLREAEVDIVDVGADTGADTGAVVTFAVGGACASLGGVVGFKQRLFLHPIGLLKGYLNGVLNVVCTVLYENRNTILHSADRCSILIAVFLLYLAELKQ